jgi:hypothetical protein
MSKYTTNFKTLIQMEIVTRDYIEDIFKDYELTDYLTPEEVQVITTRGTWSKDKLARKIVDHYYFKDIGFETIGMFKHYAKIQMQEIMESKLPLIYSAAIKYDPLVNVDYTETLSRNVTSEQSSNGSGLVINSDTPQTNINKNNLLNGSYASTASATDQEASGNNTTDEDYTKTIKGNSGVSATAQKMVEQYRDNIRAIDYEIIKELNDLFIGLF